MNKRSFGNIEKNLGNVERVFRLLFAVVMVAWITTLQTLNGIEWFVLTISVMLILNGVFARCYLWYILDINTSNPEDDNKAKGTQCV